MKHRLSDHQLLRDYYCSFVDVPIMLQYSPSFLLLQEEVQEERDERFIQVQAPRFSIQLFSPVNWQVSNSRLMQLLDSDKSLLWNVLEKKFDKIL